MNLFSGLSHGTLSRLTLLLATSCMLAACASTPGQTSLQKAESEEESYAAPERTGHTQDMAIDEDGSFEVASVASDSTLSEMRGGFLFVGGLKINFGLTSATAINNSIVTTLTLSTKGLNGSIPKSLSQLLQNGMGNQASGQNSAVTNTNSNTNNAASAATTVASNAANNVTTPSVTVPEVTIPEVTVPDVDVPDVEIPAIPAGDTTQPPVSSTLTATNIPVADPVTSQINNPVTNMALPITSSLPVSTVPYNVLTVVQNTLNNQVIQNVNVLDITVSNMAAYRNQQLAFTQRFGYIPQR